MKLNRLSHKVTLNFWHLEWCTKYRYKMMRKLANRNMVAAAIRKAATEHKIKIIKLEVMPEHVHLSCTLPNGMTDSKALGLLKGRSAYLIFKHKPEMRLRYPKNHFWSSGNCSLTVGYNTLETTNNYIQNQQTHHEVAFA